MKDRPINPPTKSTNQQKDMSVHWEVPLPKIFCHLSLDTLQPAYAVIIAGKCITFLLFGALLMLTVSEFSGIFASRDFFLH